MKSGNLKLLIILLFLAVNSFFIFNILRLYEAKTYFSYEEISEAVQVVNKKGVNINKDAVMREKTVPDTIKLEYDSKGIEKFADNLMQNDYGTFTIPDGHRFANDTESLLVSSDYSFEYQNLDFSFSTESATAFLSSTSVDKNDSKKIQKLFDNIFSNITSDSHKITFNIEKSARKDSLIYVEATQCVDGFLIDNAGFIAIISDNQIIFAKGTLYIFEKLHNYSSDYCDSINILFELEPSDALITDMEIIYYPVLDKDSSLYLAPTYKFTYDNSNVQFYDATSALKREK